MPFKSHPGRAPSNPPRLQAFTLVELLVVIAIVALLAAILFPVFARAKAAAKQTTCLSNLRQIGTAFALYLADYDDLYPYAIDPIDRERPEIWSDEPAFQALLPTMPLLHEILQPYTKSRDIFRCPADSGMQVKDDDPAIPFPASPTMFARYGTSYFFRTELAFVVAAHSSLARPSEINVLKDGGGHWHSGAPPMTPTTPDPFALYQRYRYNTLFADGHAKSISSARLDQAWLTPLY